MHTFAITWEFLHLWLFSGLVSESDTQGRMEGQSTPYTRKRPKTWIWTLLEKHNIPPGSQNFAADEFMYVFSMSPDPAAFTSPVIRLAYFKGLHFKERGA